VTRDAMTSTASKQHQEIRQRDDGLWQIGFDDSGPGPFETREFAMSVAGSPPVRRDVDGRIRGVRRAAAMP
jgi:hypothetical protein